MNKNELIKDTEEAIGRLKVMQTAQKTNPRANICLNPDRVESSIKQLEERIEFVKNNKIFK